jgi:hypothetical protein
MRPKRTVFAQLAIAAACAAWACFYSTAVAADPSTDANPKKLLAAKGLTPVGEVWICADEARARRRIEGLDRLEVQCRKAQERVDRRVADNESVANSLAKKKEEIEAARKKLAEEELTGSEKKQAEDKLRKHVEQYEKLRAQHKSSRRLGEDPSVRQDVVRLVNIRAQLAVDMFEAKRLIAELPVVYRRLAADREVSAALSHLGKARLGPAKDYATDPSLARAVRTWATEKAPVYREDNHFRVCSIVNERVPATWSLRYSDGPTVLPHSLASAAGISVDARARKATYAVDATRRLEVREITIDRIDIGSVTLRNVTAYVLPPEGEDLGAKLGRAAYDDYTFDVDGSQLQLQISPGKSAAATPMRARQLKSRTFGGRR